LRAAVDDLGPVARQAGVRVEWFAGDVGREHDAHAMIEAAVERLGGLDILINNAAVGIIVETASMTAEQWRETIDTNLGGVFYCTHAAIPHLRQRGGGWIINISSLASQHPFAGGAAYSATKAGLNAFSEALMQELRYDGIRVSTVCPGSVLTGFGGSDASAAAEWKLAPENVARVVVDLIVHACGLLTLSRSFPCEFRHDWQVVGRISARHPCPDGPDRGALPKPEVVDSFVGGTAGDGESFARAGPRPDIVEHRRHREVRPTARGVVEVTAEQRRQVPVLRQHLPELRHVLKPLGIV